MGQKSGHPADVVIGLTIRARRMEIGLSQEGLARKIGVSFQQVQKYEKGTNRVSGSRIGMVAAALGCVPADLIPDEQAVAEVNPDAAQFIAWTGFRSVARLFARADPDLRSRMLKVLELMMPDPVIQAEAANEDGGVNPDHP